MRLGIMVILALTLGIVAVIVVVTAGLRDRHAPADPGIGTLRRVVLLGLSLLSLLAVGNGAAWLAGSLLLAAAAGSLGAVNDTTFALGVAFTAVGIPSYLGFRGAVRRTVRAHPIETRFLARHLYLHGVRAGAAVAATIALADWGSALLGAGAGGGAAAAGRALVWGAVAWAHHRRVRAEFPTTDAGRAVHALLLDAVGTAAMIATALAVGEALAGLLLRAHDALWGALPLGHGDLFPAGVRIAFASAVAFGLLRVVVERENGPHVGGVTRAIATYAFGIVPGVVAVTAAAGVALFELLDLLPGGAARAMAERTVSLPGVIAALVVGGGVWGFHAARARAEAGTDAARARSGARTTLHLIASIGLIAAAIGLGHALSGLLWAAVGGDVARIGSPLRDGLVLGATLLAVGLPTWLLPWRTLQGWVAADPADEGRALARRVYLLLTLMVGTATLIVSFGYGLFVWVERALGGSIDLAWGDARIAFAVALTSAAVAGYQGWVWRGDARRAAVQR